VIHEEGPVLLAPDELADASSLKKGAGKHSNSSKQGVEDHLTLKIDRKTPFDNLLSVPGDLSIREQEDSKKAGLMVNLRWKPILNPDLHLSSHIEYLILKGQSQSQLAPVARVCSTTWSDPHAKSNGVGPTLYAVQPIVISDSLPTKQGAVKSNVSWAF
jgi:hypothetical protein